jgi:hypothetical protein
LGIDFIIISISSCYLLAYNGDGHKLITTEDGL